MEAAFEKMKKDGTNNVDNLTQWLKDAKIVEGNQDAENKVKKLFDDAKDKKNVEFQKFKDVVNNLAKEQNKPIDDYMKSLVEAIPKVTEAFKAAAAATAAAAAAVTGALSGQSK